MNRPLWIPDSFPKFGVLRFEAELENLLEYDSGVHMGWFMKKQRPKISCYCPFKILSITKRKPGGKKISNSKLLHGQKYSENCGSEGSSCGLQKKLRLRSCCCGATFLKKLRNCDCGSASFKLRNCDCGIKKSCACPPLQSITIHCTVDPVQYAVNTTQISILIHVIHLCKLPCGHWQISCLVNWSLAEFGVFSTYLVISGLAWPVSQTRTGQGRFRATCNR